MVHAGVPPPPPLSADPYDLLADPWHNRVLRILEAYLLPIHVFRRRTRTRSPFYYPLRAAPLEFITGSYAGKNKRTVSKLCTHSRAVREAMARKNKCLGSGTDLARRHLAEIWLHPPPSPVNHRRRRCPNSRAWLLFTFDPDNACRQV
jgi:hypothetical protein